MTKEFIKHLLVKKNKVQKRIYQELLTIEAIKQNTLVVAPTGLGKTIIAVLLIAYTYKPNKSVLFLAPTKPLISQHKKSLESTLELKNIILLTGEVTPSKRKEIYKQKGIIICATPQTIRNDINNNLIDKKNFNLIIFDEAHRAIGNYSYCEISLFFKDIKRLALTASPGSKRSKIQEVADNLGINNVEIRTEEDTDVKKYIKDVSLDIKYLKLDEYSKKISDLIEQFIQKKIEFLRKFNFKISNRYTKKEIIALQGKILFRISKRKDSVLFLALSIVSSVLKIYHAKELIETQGIYSFRNYLKKLILESKTKKASRSLKQIISSKEIAEILSLLRHIKSKNIVYSKEAKLIEIVDKFIEKNPNSKVLIFSNFRDTATNLSNLLNKNKHIKSTRFVGQATKVGDKGLSQKEQSKIILDFKNKIYNVLVCTSVGEEGLDIPSVDLVVFYDAVASEIRSIQRRGRTGRFNVGKVVVLINKNTIDEHYYNVSLNKEKKMKTILKNFNKRKPRKIKKQKNILDY